MIPRGEIPNDFDLYGNDFAGGKGDMPGIIVRNVLPEVRREVRNARYNLGYPSRATLLRLMRRAGANDAVRTEILQVVKVSPVQPTRGTQELPHQRRHHIDHAPSTPWSDATSKWCVIIKANSTTRSTPSTSQPPSRSWR